MLEIALAYWERGWSIFPLLGKKARVQWRQYQAERASREQIVAWWTEWPDAGIGVCLGPVSGIVRIDADGAAALAKLVEYGEFPVTAEFVTPAGGRGYLLAFQEGVVTEVIWKGPGDHEELRVQSDGAYTVVPPSAHPDGGNYEWVREGPVAPIPSWLRDRYVERVLCNLVRELRPTLRQPEREEVLEALQHLSADDYDRWVQVGMALRSAGDEMLEVWIEWSKTSDKYQEGECERKWRSFNGTPGGVTTRSILFWAEKEGYKPVNRHEPLTDLGNARILSRMGDGKLLHSDRWGWLAWDGRRWALDGAVKKVQEMQKTALEYRLNCAIQSLAKHLTTDPDAVDYDAKRKSKMRTVLSIRKHEDEARIRGARALAESEPSLSADYRRFDRRLYLFNCWNGTLDLETGDLRQHDPRDMLTQLCPTPYDMDAECPRWEQFLRDIIPDDAVRTFVRQFLGASLTGDISLQVMPVFWGSGSNGKSTLIATVMHVLGEDYSMKAKRDLLMQKRHNEHPTSLARLRGKRFVACVESSEEGRLDETLVKELTGGDSIAARRMREDEWEFVPSHKAVLVTNHKPEVRGTDNAIWRRLPLVPFTASFDEDDPRRDPTLPEKLQAEAAGILRWMVDGCQEWLAAGRKLSRPEAIKEATATYRQEQDRVGSFLTDRCVVGEGLKVRVEKLMEAYISWCILNKHPQLNGNAFGRALSEKGFHLEAKGSKYRVGLDIQQQS
jgi:P4 family phage/plasmid primase-like protien